MRKEVVLSIALFIINGIIFYILKYSLIITLKMEVILYFLLLAVLFISFEIPIFSLIVNLFSLSYYIVFTNELAPLFLTAISVASILRLISFDKIFSLFRAKEPVAETTQTINELAVEPQVCNPTKEVVRSTSLNPTRTLAQIPSRRLSIDSKFQTPEKVVEKVEKQKPLPSFESMTKPSPIKELPMAKVDREVMNELPPVEPKKKPILNIFSNSNTSSENDFLHLLFKTIKKYLDEVKDVIMEILGLSETDVENVEKYTDSITKLWKEQIEKMDDNFFKHHLIFGGTGSGKTYLMKQHLPIFFSHFNNVVVLDGKDVEFIQWLFPLNWFFKDKKDVEWLKEYFTDDSVERWWNEGFKNIKTKSGKDVEVIILYSQESDVLKVLNKLKELNIPFKGVKVEDYTFSLSLFSSDFPSVYTLSLYFKNKAELPSVGFKIHDEFIKNLNTELKNALTRKFTTRVKSDELIILIKRILLYITIHYYINVLKETGDLDINLFAQLLERLIFDKVKTRPISESEYEELLNEVSDETIKERLKANKDKFLPLLNRFLSLIGLYEISTEINLDDLKRKIEDIYLNSALSMDFDRTHLEMNFDSKKCYFFILESQQKTSQVLSYFFSKPIAPFSVLVMDELLNKLRGAENVQMIMEKLQNGLNLWRSQRISLITLYQEVPTASTFRGFNINEFMRSFKNVYFFNARGKSGMENYLPLNMEQLAKIVRFQNKVKKEMKSHGYFVNLWLGLTESKNGFFYNEMNKVPHIDPASFKLKL